MTQKINLLHLFVFVHFAIEDDDEQQVIYSTQLSIQGSHVRFSLFFFIYKKNLQYFIMSFECVWWHHIHIGGCKKKNEKLWREIETKQTNILRCVCVVKMREFLCVSYLCIEFFFSYFFFLLYICEKKHIYIQDESDSNVIINSHLYCKTWHSSSLLHDICVLLSVCLCMWDVHSVYF